MTNKPWEPRTERLSADEAEALRQELINTCVEPRIKKVFAKYPQVQSAVLLVAQYWDDEADDAVHDMTLYSEFRDPDIAEFMRRTRDEGYGKRLDEAFSELEAKGEAGAGDPEPMEMAEVFFEGPASSLPHSIIDETYEPDQSIPWWDRNGDAITAFAAFCEEDCHQEMLPGEGFSPYAIFRRSSSDPASLDMERIGKMLRPEHDGTPTQWGLQEAKRRARRNKVSRSLFSRIKKLWD